MGLSLGHLIVVLIVILLLFGASRVPQNLAWLSGLWRFSRGAKTSIFSPGGPGEMPGHGGLGQARQVFAGRPCGHPQATLTACAV